MLNGEDAILELLGKYFKNQHRDFLMGRGDDCALIKIPSAGFDLSHSFLAGQKKHDNNSFEHLLALSSDIFTENTHFRSRYFSAAQIGHKSLAVNISDLASSGASPNSFVLNLTLTDEQDLVWLEEFFASMASLSQAHNMGLCGGDLAKSPSFKNLSQDEKSGLNISITVLGDYSHGGIPLFRHKYFNHSLNKLELLEDRKDEEDVIFVIGEIGLARAGLFALEKTKSKTEVEKTIDKYNNACRAHLTPRPLVEEGLFLSSFAKEFPIFLMDVSDGLMRDISRLLMRQGLLRSKNVSKGKNIFNLGADLYLAENNLHSELLEFCAENRFNPIQFAYEGGEDYALLGICSKDGFALLEESFINKSFAKLWKLGEIVPHELKLNHKIVEERGFDHFC